MKKPFILAALALTAGAVFAHAKLQNSTPAQGATVSPAPAEIRLQYNEPVEAAMSSVKVTGPGDVIVPTAKVAADKGDDKTLVLALPGLAPGAYRAEWATMGHDGHPIKGEIRFTVR